ncbi:MAG: T9SS type A sorting domain-containing protein [Bacteroidetes bacterium]|nr:T9SS type A sorting domain-containing protein [Bacteroidota bacterium]
MRKIYIQALVIFCASLSMAQSPITLTAVNFPGSNDTLRYTNAQLSSVGNYTQTGTNFTWNYSNLVYSSQGVRDFKLALQTPYAFFFFGFNEYGEKIADNITAGPLTITNYYNYYKKQTSPVNAFVADGIGMTFSSVPVPSYYSDKDELYIFPLTYSNYDSTSFKFSTPTTTALPFTYKKTGYRVTKADGWGTITTPYGTANCLRIVTTQYSQDTIKYNAFSFGFPNNQRSYQWLTIGEKIPYLEVSGALAGANFTPNQARYRDNYQNPAGVRENNDLSAIEFYPNPGKDKLWLNFTRNGEFFVEVLGMDGKTIKAADLNSLNTAQSIDISELSPAIYIIKVREKQSVYFYKFIKE